MLKNAAAVSTASSASQPIIATVSGCRADCLPQRDHFMARDAAVDEDDTRAAVGVGPFGKRHRWMEDMVHAVDHDRRRLTAKVENSLDPQQVLSACAAQLSKPVRNRHPLEGFFERKYEAHDRCVVAVMGMTGMLVHITGSCERVLVKPPRHIDPFLLGIDQSGTE